MKYGTRQQLEGTLNKLGVAGALGMALKDFIIGYERGTQTTYLRQSDKETPFGYLILSKKDGRTVAELLIPRRFWVDYRKQYILN